MSTMADKLKIKGYTNRIVGKWDVGMATPGHHPRARSFDSFLGYWHHSNDYWTMNQDPKCDDQEIKDLWRYNASFDGPATDLFNSPSCNALFPLSSFLYPILFPRPCSFSYI